MQSLDLPAEDWDSLLSLAFGRAVVQVGHTDGSDTVRLARTASMVLAIGPDYRALGEELKTSVEAWNAAVTAADIRGRVIGTFMPYGLVLPVWPPDTFGLAVINPAALASGDLVIALEQAVCCASRIAIIDPGGALDMPALLDAAVPDMSTATVRSGSLWVVNTVTTGHAVMGVA